MLHLRTAVAEPAAQPLPPGAQPETDVDGRRPGRQARDRVVDGCYVVVAAVLGVLSLLATLSEEPPMPNPPVGVDLAYGALACAALLLRRRWPVGLALALTVAEIVASSTTGAALLALLTVAMHRPWRVTAVVIGLNAVSIVGLLGLAPITPRQYWESVVAVLLIDAVLAVSGMLVRSQRQLVRSRQVRARQAEEEQRLRIEEARRLERERIAREMHDVLAHRISLLTMHAGALEFRPDTPPAQVARAAGVIRSCAFQALEDLREVIGVLRDDAHADRVDPARPQPTLADLPELLGDSRRTGTPVSLDSRIDDLGAVPGGIGRHAYRIVQEGLTNARKHAPGAEVRVLVAGGPGTELTVELRNRLPAAVEVGGIPGAGAGLIGLRERADLVGGRLEHGRTAAGDFRLWTSLPWLT